MSDNPHYLTPQEAKYKTCPFMSYRFEKSTDISYITDDSVVRCDADLCMAWRWKTERIVDPVYYATPYDRYSTTHGYCGKVPV
jgi:hypothetical protein